MRQQRLLRITRLLGQEKTDRLGRMHVAVVGLGAVGGFCLEALARSGVGEFTLVDFDTFSPSNLNRQILALQSTLGRSKAQVAAERLRDIGDDMIIHVIDEAVSEKNVQMIVEGKSLVVDAIDSVDAKCLLLKTCVEKNIPVVSSMGAALRTDISRIRIADLMDTKGCPLAKQVRTRLRHEGIGKGIEVVFSDEEPAQNAPATEQEIEESGDGTLRKVLGSMPTVTGMFGLTLAHLALGKLIS